jgi:hypothetical protein
MTSPFEGSDRMKTTGLISTGLALLISACAGPRAITGADWLPAADGWTVRDVDDDTPLRWVIYERPAWGADVKEFRIVGLIDGEPEAVAQALRRRLLDDDNLPDGTDRTLVRQSTSEVVFHGYTSLPFPFDDREVTERIRFRDDPRTGVFRVDVDSIDPGDAPRPGVVRVPLVQNRFVLLPAEDGRTIATIDTVHDLGDGFLNWVIHGPVCGQLVTEVEALDEMTAPVRTAAHRGAPRSRAAAPAAAGAASTSSTPRRTSAHRTHSPWPP